MKNLLLLTLSFTSIEALGAQKVIYGSDDRIEPNQEFTSLTQASVVQLYKKQIIGETDERYIFESVHLGETLSFCPSQAVRFHDQFVAGSCSGVLISEDTILTAGHCIEEKKEGALWVFDYHNDKIKILSNTTFSIAKENVYERSEIIISKLEGDLDKGTLIDYGLVRLDRKVKDRTPVSYRQEESVVLGDPLIVLGYPVGLPLKIVSDAYVIHNEFEKFFIANSDTFISNSGSPVFNPETGILEGILVRGEDDFAYDEVEGCLKIKNCTSDGSDCQGEGITRVTEVLELRNLK